MFEDQPQSEIDARRARDPEFRALHDQHRKLNKQCMDAELGVLPIDDDTASNDVPRALTHPVTPGTA